MLPPTNQALPVLSTPAKAHAALANLYIARRRLKAQGVSASAACSEGAETAATRPQTAPDPQFPGSWQRIRIRPQPNGHGGVR
jgi:hypothetical protein